MKILKLVLRLSAIISLSVYIATREVVPAVFMLVFASISLGILIGEKMQRGGKYESRKN